MEGSVAMTHHMSIRGRCVILLEMAKQTPSWFGYRTDGVVVGVCTKESLGRVVTSIAAWVLGATDTA